MLRKCTEVNLTMGELMARKHDWKKRNKKKIIEISVIHEVTDSDIHILICNMLLDGFVVTQKSLNDKLKEVLSNIGTSWFIDPGGIAEHYFPFIKKATEIFQSIYGFTPKDYHDWFQDVQVK